MSHPGSSFAFDLVAPGPPEAVWDRLWDLNRHTASIPLTRVSGGPLGPAATFVGRTAIGPLGFDDTMVVRQWDPPRRAVIDKVGSVLRGSIEVLLEPQGLDTRIRWTQSFGARGVPDGLARLTAPMVRTAYRSAVRRITAP